MIFFCSAGEWCAASAERGEERADLVVEKSAPEVTETSFSLCFANAARIHNPKMCFFFLSFTPWFFSSNPKKCCAFKSPLFFPALLLFYEPILVVLNIPPHFASQETFVRQKHSGWRMHGGDGGVFRNRNLVMELFSPHQRKRQGSVNFKKFSPE